MPRIRVKICGVRDAEIARAAADAGADAIGLNFVERSPRYVRLPEAGKVLAALPAFVEPIALFADADADTIRKTVTPLGIRTVQLHGSERPHLAEELAPLRIIKAFACEDQLAAAIREWKGVPNLTGYLIDAPASSNSVAGGGGVPFDWLELAAVRTEIEPLILAGGLTPQNVAEAIRTIRPYAVDVSSGVEIQRGVKDGALIRAFCRAVQNTNA